MTKTYMGFTKEEEQAKGIKYTAILLLMNGVNLLIQLTLMMTLILSAKTVFSITHNTKPAAARSVEAGGCYAPL